MLVTKMKNILEFGAVADGMTDCTEAIQRAIDSAAAEGGGRIYFPAGKYVSRTIYLKDHCVLRLEAGSQILASLDYCTYGHPERKPLWSGGSGNPMWSQYWAFIVAIKTDGAGIEGEGVINGRGKYGENFPCLDDPEQRRPFLVVFDRCTNSFIRGVTLKDPAAYNFLGFDVRNMQLHGVKVLSRQSGNGDGLDFDGGRDVTISDCYVDAGDDAISLKTTKKGEICERFTITNCILKSRWAAIRLGTESTDSMRDITVTGCVFEDCRDGLKLQTCGGALYENMVFTAITMRNVIRPFFITANRFRMSFDEKGAWPQGSEIRDLLFSDFVIDMPPDGEEYDHTGFVISGTKDTLIHGLSFRNIKVRFYGDNSEKNLDVPQLYNYSEQYPEMPHLGDLPTGGVYVRYARDIVFSDCTFKYKNPDARPILFCDHAQVRLCNCSLDTGAQGFCSQIEGASVQPLKEEEEHALLKSHEKADTYYDFVDKMTNLADCTAAMKNKRLYGYDTEIELPSYITGCLSVSAVGSFKVWFDHKEIKIHVPGDYFWANRVILKLPSGVRSVRLEAQLRGEPVVFYWN